MDKLVREASEKYGHDYHSRVVWDNLATYFKASAYSQSRAALKNIDPAICVNEALISDRHLIATPNAIRGGEIKIATLIGIYKRAKSNHELDFLSEESHVPSQARELRDDGYIMGTDREGGPFTIKLDGVRKRIVRGFEPVVKVEKRWNLLNDNETKIWRKSFGNSDWLGRSIAKARRPENDHSTPAQIRRRRGESPDLLTRESLLDGSAWDKFQVFAKETNDEKRQACDACQRGEDIPIPGGFILIKSAYAQRYDPQRGCEGCLWKNHLKPLNPSILPKDDFQAAVAAQAQRTADAIAELAKCKRKAPTQNGLHRVKDEADLISFRDD